MMLRRPVRSRRGPGRAPSTISLPTTIFGANLILWWRATNVTQSGTVSAIADLSGTGNTGQQPTSGNQPTFVASGIGGFPDISYGGNAWLYGTSTDIVTTALTAWCIFKTSTLTAAGEQPFGKGEAATEWLFAGRTGGKLAFAVNSGSAVSNVALNDNAPHYAIGVWDKNVASGLMTLYIDGVAQTITGTSAASISGTDTWGTGAEIGNTPSTVFAQFIGNIPDVGLVNVAATAGQIAALNAYLKQRAGL